MKESVSIRFAGDLMLGGGVLEKIEKHGPLFPFEKIIDQKINFDAFFINLECTLAIRDNPPFPERIHLHSNPEIVNGLKKSGINIVSLANNHAFDYGIEGFIDTKKILTNSGIFSVGGGENQKEAAKSTTIDINGLQLSFLGYCSKDTGCLHFASDSKYGVAEVNLDNSLRDVQKAKKNCDILIVSIHWGDEFRDYPDPKNVEIARRLIEHGATIVVGHHAHVFQGYEAYQHGLIIYDLGSFIFGDIVQNGYKFYLKKRKHKEGIIADCLLGKRGLIDFKFNPVYINHNFQATFPRDSTKKKIMESFLKKSERLSENDYESFYEKYIFKVNLVKKLQASIKFVKKLFYPRTWYLFAIKIVKKCLHVMTSSGGYSGQ